MGVLKCAQNKETCIQQFYFFNNQRQENVTKDNSLGELQLGLSFLSYSQCLQKTGTGEEGVEGMGGLN